LAFNTLFRVAVAVLGIVCSAGHAQPPPPVSVGILGYGPKPEYTALEQRLERELRVRPESPRLSYRIQSWSVDYNTAAEDAGIEQLKVFRPDIILLMSPELVEKVLPRIAEVPLVVHGQTYVSRLPAFKSIARPGGRVTGFLRDPASFAKRVEVLQGFCSSVRRVGAIISADLRNDEQFLEFLSAENDRLRVNGALLVPLYMQDLDLLPSLPAIIETSRLDALIVGIPVSVRERFGEVTSAMQSLRIPHIYPFVSAVEHGGALAAQPSPYDIAKTGAEYISRIAHGEKAGEIPVQIRRTYDIAVHTERIKDFKGCDPRRIARIATRFFP
jgi:ABC-type uncharacterized transport system substrate-binding protein